MVLFNRKTRLKVGLLLWLTVVNFVVGAAFAWNSYHRQKEALLGGIDNQLRAAANALPALLPVGYHDRMSRGEVGQEEYLALAHRLTDYANAAGVFYIYSFLVDPAGNFLTASTSGSEKEWREQSLPTAGQPYVAPLASQAVMISGTPSVVEDSDEFGQWRSYLLPLRTTDGTAFLAGADIEISKVRELLTNSLRDSIFIGLAGFLLASVFTYWISSVVSHDLLRVVGDTARIARFQLDGAPSSGSAIVEVDELMRSVEDMKSGLRSFRKFVPADLVRQLLLSGQEARLGGREAELTVLFSDLADFTALSEALSPEALVAHTGEYLGAMSQEIARMRGTVDKYIGDSIMAFWGAPDENPNHALDACRAAIACHERLVQLNSQWKAEGRPLLRARTGLHAGPLIVGNLGSENRLNYTVVGDTVNVASRLEGLNKYYHTTILVTDRLCELAGDSLIVRPVDCVAVQGRQEGLVVFELLGLRDDPRSGEMDSLAAAGKGLWEAYVKRNWKECIDLADSILKSHPSDGPARVLLERCRSFLVEPPPSDWNGVWRMTGK